MNRFYISLFFTCIFALLLAASAHKHKSTMSSHGHANVTASNVTEPQNNASAKSHAKDNLSNYNFNRTSKTTHWQRVKPKTRVVRQINPYAMMNGGLGGLFGTGSATGIATANAAMGQSLTNGNSFTDPFGNSRSMSSGFASGYSPSSTSIATSNSQGHGRRRRQVYGYPPVFGNMGSGSAINAANAAMGQTQSNGNSVTDPFGNTVSFANGQSSGYAPSTSSIATSNSQGSPYGASAFMGRKKREANKDLVEDGYGKDSVGDVMSRPERNQMGLMPYGYFNTPVGRSIDGQPLPNQPFPGMVNPALWNPANNPSFVASMQAANQAIQNSAGMGNKAGTVAVSGNRPDGSIYAGKLVDYNVPIANSCVGQGCAVAPIASPTLAKVTPVPESSFSEIIRDTRGMLTTDSPIVAATESFFAATADVSMGDGESFTENTTGTPEEDP